MSSIKRLASRIIQTKSTNPFFNIAVEEVLFRNHKPETNLLYLWRNSPNIVIGRNQGAYKECNVNKMKEDNITLVRRKSGGGAVYQDLGNSIFTFLTTPTNTATAKKENNIILINALRRLGISYAKPTGRNDIQIGDKKISGSAFRLHNNTFLHHGTMMLNLNFDNMGKYLTPNKAKLKSKGIASVEARVINLSDVLKRPIEHEEWCSALKESFAKYYDTNSTAEYIDESTYVGNKEIQDIIRERTCEKYRFGEYSEFNQKMENKFDWGHVEVNLESNQGVIRKINIFSDSLYPNIIDELAAKLTNIEYDKKKLSNRFDNMTKNRPSEEVTIIKSFADWFIRQI